MGFKAVYLSLKLKRWPSEQDNPDSYHNHVTVYHLLLFDSRPGHRAVFARQVTHFAGLGHRAFARGRISAHVRIEMTAGLGAVAAL